MPYRLLVAVLFVALSLAGCRPMPDRVAPAVDLEAQPEFVASVESSFTAQRSRLESAAAIALQSSQTTASLVPLPGDLRSLAVNGQAEVVWIAGKRFVLLTADKTGFRVWDGYAYSESGALPPTVLGRGVSLRSSIPVDSNWWWIRVARAPVADLSQ